MRLADAIKELGNLKGVRVHRSHWVAQQHLIDIKKDGRRFVAVLSDDRRLPVSAPYLEDTRDMLKEKARPNKPRFFFYIFG